MSVSLFVIAAESPGPGWISAGVRLFLGLIGSYERMW